MLVGDGAGGCGRDADPGLVRDVGVDFGAAFVAGIRPAHGLAADVRNHFDIEGMRFAYDAGGHQAAIGLRFQRVIFGDIPQALQPHFDRAGAGRQRFAVAIQPRLVFRRRAVLGDGQFNGDTVIFQKTAAVFPLARGFGFRFAVVVAFAFFMAVFLFSSGAAAGGQQQGQRQCADQRANGDEAHGAGGHGICPCVGAASVATNACPVSRWISISARCASSATSSCCLRAAVRSDCNCAHSR